MRAKIPKILDLDDNELSEIILSKFRYNNIKEQIDEHVFLIHEQGKSRIKNSSLKAVSAMVRLALIDVNYSSYSLDYYDGATKITLLGDKITFIGGKMYINEPIPSRIPSL